MKKNENNDNGEAKVGKRAMIGAAFKKFTFLENHFSPQQITKFSFRIINSDILELQACRQWMRRHRTTWVEIAHTILLFSEKGEFLGQVGMKKVLRKEWIFWGKESFCDEIFMETIGEAIQRVGMEKVHYVAGMKSEDPRHLILSGPPGKITLSRWLEKEHEKAATLLDEEIHELAFPRESK